MTLKEYLQQQGISQHQFAELVGVTPQAVNQWVQGRRFPRPTVILKIRMITGGRVAPVDWYISSITKNRRKI